MERAAGGVAAGGGVEFHRLAHGRAQRGMYGQERRRGHGGVVVFGEVGHVLEGIPGGVVGAAVVGEVDPVAQAAPNGPLVVVQAVVLHDPVMGSPGGALAGHVAAEDDAAAVVVVAVVAVE